MNGASGDALAEVRGVEIAHRVVGDVTGASGRPTFVWGHGLTSSMEREDELGVLRWDTFDTAGDADHAAGGRGGIVRYDARGHGRSGSTPDLVDYHWRALANDQLALADHLGVGRYVAGGASMGCATALYAALLAPERIAGLVLAIPPTAWETRDAQRTAYRASAELVEAGDLDAVVAGARTAPVPDPLVDEPAWRDGFERMVYATEPARLARILHGAAITDLPVTEEVATIQVPALVLAWTGDPGHPVSTAERLHDLLPASTLHLASTADELSGWTELVVAFLDDLPA